ncbi:MAG: hypothetical protein HFI92_04660 [Lachnospiraceae bacterium]|nr:hypothetical protein [Lachnospiraceae bacterium]
MAKVTVEDGKIRYRKFLSVCELPVADLVWAYLQQEDVSAKMCCGSYHGEIGRVIVRDRNGKKQIFQFESMQEARELLEKLQGENPELAIGYTEANRKRFE